MEGGWEWTWSHGGCEDGGTTNGLGSSSESAVVVLLAVTIG